MSNDNEFKQPPLWSERHQRSMTPSEQQLYLDRAGLTPQQAFEWWHNGVFSQEAAEAIRAERTIEAEIWFRSPRNPESKERRERIDADRARAIERDLARAADERDRLAEETDFLAGLSEGTADLVKCITAVELFSRSECDGALYPADDQVFQAVTGRMKVQGVGRSDEPNGQPFFDTTILELIKLAVDRNVRAINFAGLTPSEGAQLLCCQEIWPAATSLAVGGGTHVEVDIFVNGVGFDLEPEAPRRTLGRQYAYTLGSPTAPRDYLADLSDRSSALVRRLDGIGLDRDSDNPGWLQVDEVVDGRCTATLRELADGYLTGRSSIRHQSFRETLQDAADAHTSMFEFFGLDDEEALDLFSASEFNEFFSGLLEAQINGINYDRYGGGWSVNDDY